LEQIIPLEEYFLVGKVPRLEGSFPLHYLLPNQNLKGTFLAQFLEAKDPKGFPGLLRLRISLGFPTLVGLVKGFS